MTMMTIDRETLLRPLPVKKERVELPEFGDGMFAWVHGLTAKGKNDHDAGLMNRKWTAVDPGRAKTQKERLVVRCLHNAAGERLLSEADIDAVGKWPADLLNRVFDIANRLSGGSSDSIEDLAKNSDGTGDDS